MKQRVLYAVALIILIVVAITAPAFAATSQYTGTGFKYIGDIFHEKEVRIPGGNFNFQISGKGEVSGFHSVRSSTAAAVYGSESLTNGYLFAYFQGTTAMDAAPNEHVRLLSEIDFTNRATLQTGVEMNPGESGYIRQWAASSSGSNGQYVKTNNYFGNTGGITKRNNEVNGFIDDSMRVDGYAEVWEVTEVQSGDAKAGFWSPQ